MKKLATLMALVAICGLTLISAPQDVQARPTFPKLMAQKYEQAAEQIKEKKCAVCHGGDPLGKDKKVRSDYAKALAEALGKKNEKDPKKVNAAFDTVAKKDAGEGKTYGEILEGGKLPPPAESE